MTSPTGKNPKIQLIDYRRILLGKVKQYLPESEQREFEEMDRELARARKQERSSEFRQRDLQGQLNKLYAVVNSLNENADNYAKRLSGLNREIARKLRELNG